MTKLKAIRKNVFGMKQVDFSGLVGVSQQAYSTAEKKDAMPHWYQVAIREAAKKRGIEWDDRWFFEPPLEVSQ